MTPPHIEKAARELCKHFGDEPDERDGITLEWRRWHEYESIAGEICDIAIEEAAKVGERLAAEMEAEMRTASLSGSTAYHQRAVWVRSGANTCVYRIRALAVEG